MLAQLVALFAAAAVQGAAPPSASAGAPASGATTVSPRTLSAVRNRGKQLPSIEQPTAEVLGGAGQERTDVSD